MRIAPFTSFFLDGLRLLAAMGVVFVHLGNSRLKPGGAALQAFGGCFVVAFFVLSGYVIAATTNPARSDAARYFALRLARLWTVALPALLAAYLLQKIGERFDPAFFAAFSRGHSELRYLLAAVFANEFWFSSAGPPIDVPLWSLAYEFWFYVLFGIGFYVRRAPMRNFMLLAVCGIVGPKILALFPIWLAGAGAWWLARHRCVLEKGALWIVGASAGLMAWLIMAHTRWPGEIGYAPWFYSAAWISDGLFGLGTAGLIVGIDARFHSLPVPKILNAIVKRGAGVSFSLYLLHYPLMAFCAAFLPYDPSSPIEVAGVLALILAVVYLFGSLFEPQRKRWAPRLEAVFRAVSGRMAHRSAGAGTLESDLPDAGIGRQR